jgi:hypothetical protein
MSASTKLVEKLEGIDNFRAWKYRIGLILAENDLSRFIKEEVKEPEDAIEKAKHQKDSIRAQRIIADSIKDHLIPYVSSKETPKEMFDALRKLYEGKNINRKMNLRTQLKNTKMQKGEMIQEYFSRISEIKEQLKAIGDTIDEDEFVMTALNGLARPWDAFIQSVCGRKEKLQFESLWEECIQEETRVANREALLARDDDQALATHTKGGRKKPYFKRESHREHNHQTNSTIKNLIQEIFRRKDNARDEISHLYNAIIVIRWDTRQTIVQSEKKSTRGSTKDNMLILPKMKNHL